MRKLIHTIAFSMALLLPATLAQSAPIHDAAKNGDTQKVIELLNAGANIDARDEDGFTPLHVAAGGGTVEKVNALLSAGANIEARTEDGFTPLHVAAGHGTAETVNALISAGADASARDENGWTPFDLVKFNPEKLEGTDAWWRLNEARFR